MSPEQLKKLYRKKHTNAFFLMLFSVFAVIYAADALIYREPLLLIFTAIVGALALLMWRRRPKVPFCALSPEAAACARGLYDRSHKRAFGWLYFNCLLSASPGLSPTATTIRKPWLPRTRRLWTTCTAPSAIKPAKTCSIPTFSQASPGGTTSSSRCGIPTAA